MANPQSTPHATVPADLYAPQAAPISLAELCDAYVAFARGEYTKHGRLTQTYHKARKVTEILRHYLPGTLPIGCLGPRLLTCWRGWLCAHPDQRWSRATITEYVRTVVAMFRWAISREWTDQAHVDGLRSLPPLRRGRGSGAGGRPLREGGKVVGVSPELLARIIEHCSPIIADMLRLQELSGMRPSEVVSIRPCDLEVTSEPGVLHYRVAGDVNKMEHEDRDRKVMFGPQGVEILRRWAGASMSEPIFRPSVGVAAEYARRRQAKVTPLWESHDPKVRERRRRANGVPRRRCRDAYTVDSYRRAVQRACDRAGVPRIGPNQVRHSAATKFAEASRLEVAQLLLGHADIKTTLRYVHPHDRDAARVVREIG